MLHLCHGVFDRKTYDYPERKRGTRTLPGKMGWSMSIVALTDRRALAETLGFEKGCSLRLRSKRGGLVRGGQSQG